MTYYSSNFPVGWAIGVAVITWAIIKLNRFGRRESYLPPGPPTKPILGNVLEFPTTGPQYRFTEWAKEYGDVYSLKLVNSTIVILNSYEDVRQLLDKNSGLTADRPPHHFSTLYDGPGNNMVLTGYTDKWRSCRRAAHQVLSLQATKSHLPIQEAESIQLMYDLMVDPDTKIRDNLRRYTTSVIMSVMFGVRIARSTNPIFQEFWGLIERIVDLTAPTTHPPVDLIPILKYVPERFASWKTECRDLYHFQRKVWGDMLRPVRERLARDEGNGCFMEEVCQRAKEWNLDEDQVLYFGALMMQAGSETVATFLSNFVLCLAAHPEAVQKAQEEIDKVVGSDRLPHYDDFQNLPYVQALIHETHRFRPVTPIAIPHASIGDVSHGEYLIPKGAVIIQNTWGILHDDRVFNDVDVFRPERFLENPDLCKYTDLVFGSGRRFCAGVHLAKSSLASVAPFLSITTLTRRRKLINAMNILWAFNIEKSLDKAGNVIEPNLTDYTDGLVFAPKELRCTFKPRSPHHEATLRQAFRHTAESFYPFEQDLSEDDKQYVKECRARA